MLDDRNVPGFDTSTGVHINYEIGRIRAEHLLAQGYSQIAFAHLRDRRQDPYGDDRDQAVRDVRPATGAAALAVIGRGVNAKEAAAAIESVRAGCGVTERLHSTSSERIPPHRCARVQLSRS